jgi:hypothetical protein
MICALDRLQNREANLSLTDTCDAAVADYAHNARLYPQCNAYTQGERLHNPGCNMAASAAVIRDSVISVSYGGGRLT